MFANDKKRGKSERNVLGAGNIVAVLLGVTLSFVVTPLLYNGTVDWIAGYGDAQYAQGLGGFLRIIWGPVVAILCTAMSVVSITTGTRIGIIALIDFLNNR